MVALRAEVPDAKAFDDALYQSITLGEEDRAAPDIWEEFTSCFRRAWRLFDDAELRTGHWRRVDLLTKARTCSTWSFGAGWTTRSWPRRAGGARTLP